MSRSRNPGPGPVVPRGAATRSAAPVPPSRGDRLTADRRAVRLLLTLALLGAVPGLARAQAADSLRVPDLPSGTSLVTAGDLRTAFLSVAGVAMIAALDQGLADEAPESRSAFARTTATGAEHMGNPTTLLPAFAAAYLAGRITGNSELSRGTLHVAAGVAASAAVSSVLKEVIGRSRPNEAPADPDVIRPFSGHTSFPSGHTTVAFSLAAGIDQETSARWVPWLAYPLAGLVGWSRMRDNRHWASDVAAGAVVGVWTTRKMHAMFFDGPAAHRELTFGLVDGPADVPAAAGATLTFR